MNRLVLIGNGFDLAHQLPTSYQHFINWYMGDLGERLMRGENKVVSDALCSFVLKDNINLCCWGYVWGHHYVRNNPFIPWNPREEVLHVMSDREVCNCTITPFLQKIMKCMSTNKWVDIEREYYSLLLEEKMTKDEGIILPDYKSINLQLDYLRTKLVEYLNGLSSVKTPFIAEIQNKIFAPISKNEIALSSPSYYDYRTKEQNRPSAIMLLNFNYTKTLEHYILNRDNVSINYIHGRLDVPESVIFGYGDEVDSGFKKLQNMENNECLRHMKSIHYLESDNYRRMLEFVESAPFQICIMGHSCGNSDRTLLNTLFEHRNCVSIKPYYYVKKNGEDNYLDLTMNISRNFTDMKLMRDRVVNKTYCEPLTRNY